MTDPISNIRLQAVHPLLRQKVLAAADELEAKGIYIRIAQGLRTYAEQDELFQLGRTVLAKPDGTAQGIVTNARGGYSNHNFGCAVDCYPFLHGSTGAVDFNSGSQLFKAMVAVLKAQGLTWGGDWTSIHDAPHFQLEGVPVTPTEQDRQLYAQGGLTAVWQQYSGELA